MNSSTVLYANALPRQQGGYGAHMRISGKIVPISDLLFPDGDVYR